eukprot:403352753
MVKPTSKATAVAHENKKSKKEGKAVVQAQTSKQAQQKVAEVKKDKKVVAAVEQKKEKKQSSVATTGNQVPISKNSKKTLKSTKETRKRRTLAKRFNKLKVKASDVNKKAIVYVGHLPKGFNEKQLKGFFEQFGSISKIRLSRSKKTSRSRGYAYLEYNDKETAAIASKAMNEYMLFGKQLDCHVVENAHRETFKNGNRDWKFIPTQVMFRNKKNSEKTDEDKAAKVKGLLQKEKEKRDRLKELGIKYEFTGYSGLVDALKSVLQKQAKEQVKAELPKKQEETSTKSKDIKKKAK